MKLVVASYSTSEYKPIYEKYLKPSLATNSKLAHVHININTQPKWNISTLLKPSIIMSVLEQGSDVLYVDSDAVIKSNEFNKIREIIPDGFIAACHFLPHAAWYGNDSTLIEPLTGTLFFKFCPESIELVKKWGDLCTSKKYATDGEAWRAVIKDRTDIFDLPLKWCYINSLPDGRDPRVECKDPIVVHTQASRKTRRTMKCS